MIINGRIPGDPTEVARAMAEKGGKTPTADAVGTVAEEPSIKTEGTVAEEALGETNNENTAKPEEKKKAAVKKGSRKSSKKAEKEAGLFTDENAE